MQILKKKLLPFFSAFLVGLALTGGTVLAHTMPFSETTLILEKGHGLHAEIRPGDPLSKVRDILGDVYQENVKDFGPFRRIIWKYYTSEFSAVTLTSNTSPSEKLPLHGYTLRGVSFHTPSGFVISMYYDKIKDKYGEATSQTETEELPNLKKNRSTREATSLLWASGSGEPRTEDTLPAGNIKTDWHWCRKKFSTAVSVYIAK